MTECATDKYLYQHRVANINQLANRVQFQQ